MLGHHLGLVITPEQRARWARLIAEAADEAGLPADPEFRSAFVAYVEWGSRIAMANSQPGTAPPPQAPVPRWGWGEAPPTPVDERRSVFCAFSGLSVVIGALIATLSPLNAEREGSGGLWGGAAYAGGEVGRQGADAGFAVCGGGHEG